MTTPVIVRMESRVSAWEQAADHKAVFLSCYLMMTRNTLAAIDRCEFGDCDWVARLLHRFADYYFDALDAYERSPESAPTVWRLAHDATHGDHTLPVQKLLVGVNAHINYDLVLTLVDLLDDEWPDADHDLRRRRQCDYDLINVVIAETADMVQDEVLERHSPWLDVFDRGLGRLDERIAVRLLSRWRTQVWRHAIDLLDDPDGRTQRVATIEQQCTRRARWLLL